MHRADDTHCYLCGEPLGKGQTNEDHVPPQRLIPISWRAHHQWVKPRVHASCNRSYSDDEQYFYLRVIAMTHKTPAAAARGAELLAGERKQAKQFRELRSQLSHRTPGGIYIPRKVVMHYEGNRTDRIVWKIARGCAYVESNTILPEPVGRNHVELLTYDQFGDRVRTEPRLLDHLLRTRPVIDIKGAFSARIIHAEQDGIRLALCTMQFFGSVVGFAHFHDGGCSCTECQQPKN